MERSVIWKPSAEISPNCPRCGCSHTKFCYYNNYSLTQPRFFCKGCRRYWTKGGSLRNVPPGGGCRKNRRSTGGLISGNNSKLSFDPKAALSGHGSPNSHGRRYQLLYILYFSPLRYNCYYLSCLTNSKLFDFCSAPINSNNGGSSSSTSSHIDLALVYANFLTQKPDLCKTKAGDENNNGVNGFDPSLEFLSSGFQVMPDQNNNHHNNNNNNNNSNVDEQILLCELDSFQERSSSGGFGLLLHPLPSQEEEAMLWSNDLMVGQSQTLLPMVVGQEDHNQEENLLTGDWSPFDLPTHDTFSRGNHDEDI